MGSRSIKNRYSVKKKSPAAGLFAVLAVVIAIIGAGVVGVYALGSSWLQDLPDYSDVDAYNFARKTEVYASDGTTLLAEFYLENREPTTLDKIGDYVLEGTVATEDERYYEHNGVDLWGVGRAIYVNLTGASLEGASTITQQFVRQTVLSDEANDISFKRKVREMYIALKLEEMYTKDEILLMYLNTINYGQGAYGIEAAAHTYFSKSANELTLAEAATLIGIPQSPTYNNPVDNPENCLQRRNLVLERMLSNNYISQQEYEEAKAQDLVLNLEQKSQDGIYLYPYFTSYVRDSLIAQFSEAEVFKGGMKVYTTIDPTIQAYAEESARDKEATEADNVEVSLTAVDPDTGYILAMVGGKDFYTDQYNLATQAKRSCGSTFKMFTLVAAIEEGISPNTYISCSATTTIGNWPVHNIYNSEYGTRTIEGAFAVSSNTAFARLITALTPAKVIETAHRMGVQSELPEVPSITLGTGEVSTDEMAGSIATVANGGTYHEVTGIDHILDYNGDLLYQSDTKGKRALTPEVAYAATEAMKSVVTYGTGTSAALSNGQPAIGKTGTGENYKDKYYIGATPQIAVAIWMGTRDQTEMNQYTIPADVFSDFVNKVLADKEIEQFPVADEPEYESYYNATLQIGGYYSNSSNDDSSDDEEDKDKDDSKKDESDSGSKPNTDSNNGSSGNSGNNGSDGNGGTTPPTNPGGTDPGGNSGNGDGDTGKDPPDDSGDASSETRG